LWVSAHGGAPYRAYYPRAKVQVAELPNCHQGKGCHEPWTSLVFFVADIMAVARGPNVASLVTVLEGGGSPAVVSLDSPTAAEADLLCRVLDREGSGTSLRGLAIACGGSREGLSHDTLTRAMAGMASVPGLSVLR
jgi:hypothetical protein